MKAKRGGFTLIELLVSISILSIMMVFLYKTYASLNRSNEIYVQKSNTIASLQKKKKVLFLDFSLALDGNKTLLNHDKYEDSIFFQTSNSLHRRYNPYIAYVVNESTLFRLESLKPFKDYPISQDMLFSVDELGKVDSFRVYRTEKKDSQKQIELFLIDIKFTNKERILLKVKALNEKKV